MGGSDGAPEEGEPDYSENYQPVPMREIQSEHFGKDDSLSNQDHGRDGEEDMAQ